MKKEINGSETIYLISLFCMPIITFIGLSLLLNNIVAISDTLSVSKYDVSDVFFTEISLYIGCWVLLFASYIFHKLGFKVGQVVIVTVSLVVLLYCIYKAINTMTSIADIVNPIILVVAALYGLIKPLPEVTVEKRKTRVKNTLAKYTPTKKNNTKKSKNNKK